MPKNVKISLIVVVSILLLSLAFGAGCIINLGTSSPVQGPDTNLINQAWSIVTRNYVVPSKVDPTTLNEGAVRGMVQSLNDPYSAYLSPNDYKLEQSNFQGSFEGIGAQVSLNKDNQVIIVAPIENSPAAKAGIKTGDVILAVDGKSTQGLSLTEVVLLIRGPAGTTVKLMILHTGETTPVEIDVVRAQINAPSVTSSMKGNVAYIKISSFDERTNDELQTALQSLDLKNSSRYYSGFTR